MAETSNPTPRGDKQGMTPASPNGVPVSDPNAYPDGQEFHGYPETEQFNDQGSYKKKTAGE